MARDIHANYAKIGFAVVLGTLAILATLVYIAGIGDHAGEVLVETYYDEPVKGLSVGSAVNFRGVKVGEVREIGFVAVRYPQARAPEDAQRVRIVMALDARKFARGGEELVTEMNGLVARGLRATLTVSGVTGLSQVEIGVPKVPAPVATLLWSPEYPLIPPSPSLLMSLADTLRVAMDRFNRMDILSVWSNVAAIAESTAKTADGAYRLIESQRGGIGSIVRNVDDTSQSVRDLSERLKENPSLLLRPADPAPLPETAKPFFAP